MDNILRHVVTESQNDMILRDLLRKHLGVSAKLLARIKRIDRGIMLNGKSVFVNVAVKTGDLVEICAEHKSANEGNLIPQQGRLDICYEDENLLIVNKPAGIPVAPAIGKIDGSLGNIVVWHYMQKGEGIIFRPVNRLDNGTSGLMVVAKNSYTHTALAEKLHTGEFNRAYIAIVHGNFEELHGYVEEPIARENGSVIKRCVHPEGKWAKTNYTVLRTFDGYSMVELELESGRTHQIRVHMSYIGHPLVGDFLYGKEEPELISRFALHSAKMQFIHPTTGEILCVKCDLPDDMNRLIEKISDINTEK